MVTHEEWLRRMDAPDLWPRAILVACLTACLVMSQCPKRETPAQAAPVPSGLCAKVDARWLMDFALRVQEYGITVETGCFEVSP